MLGCLQKNPATRRYFRRLALSMGAYMALIVMDAFYFKTHHRTGALAYTLAVLPALAILAQIVSVGMYLAEEKDEFQRNIFIEAILWGLGGVLTLTSVWGMLESFTYVRHFDPTWTLCMFWIFVGISMPFLVRRYR